MSITKTLKFGVILAEEQKNEFTRYMGCFRFIYNAYIEENDRRFNNGEKFLKDREFRDTILKELRNEHEWLRECPKHPMNYVIKSGYMAYKRFFKNIGNKPVYKSKYKNQISSFGSDNNRVRINLDTGTISIDHFKNLYICRRELKRLRNQAVDKVVSCKLVRDTIGKFYICLAIEDPTWDFLDNVPGGSPTIGIDLGLVVYACVSDGRKYSNPCRTNKRYLYADTMIRKLQKIISRKAETKKSHGLNDCYELYHSGKQDKIWYRIRKYHRIKTDIIRDFIKKTCHEIVSNRPRAIFIEDLEIHRMCRGKSRRMTKEIYDANWYYFRQHLEHKCRELRIPIHHANTNFPSTKMCSQCGNIKTNKDSTLKSRRLYVCKCCGNTIDRDLNAAINLKKFYEYELETAGMSGDTGMLTGNIALYKGNDIYSCIS